MRKFAITYRRRPSKTVTLTVVAARDLSTAIDWWMQNREAGPDMVRHEDLLSVVEVNG